MPNNNQSNGVFFIIFALFELSFVVLTIAGMWKAFAKAGEPGWACIVPIYNLVVILRIADKPLWWILLCLIPFVNFIVIILILISFAERFGKGVGFALGLAFIGVIFWPILGFGDAQFLGGPRGFDPIMGPRV